MASVFLSYARDNAAKAERIAQALEAAGHAVWWDRDLDAGSHFTAAIDEALRAAEAVVVLWSQHSVTSAWVQDEAAVGRDSGRLLPVLLDSVSPPLGFRQFQAVDLSGWSGRGKPRGLSELRKALDKLPGKPVSPRSQPPSRKRLPVPRSALFGALAAILLIGAAVAWLKLGSQHAPTLSIAAADTSQDTSSRDFAHQVALDLTRFQSVYLNSLNIREGGNFVKNADYQAEFELARDGAEAHAGIGFRVKRRSGLTWVDRLDGRADRLVDLRRQAAAALSTVTRCAMEADSSRAKLSNADFRLFLDGCTIISTNFSDVNAADIIPIFRKITKANPDFAPAHAMLAMADYSTMATAPESQRRPLVTEARAALARAKALDPTLEDAIAADAQLHPFDGTQWDHTFPILDRGLTLRPNSPLFLSLRSQWLSTVGRMEEAVVSARQASQFDPLAQPTRVNFINALAYANHVDSARKELAKAEAIWPNSSVFEDARYRLDLRYGDPKNALRLLQQRGTVDFELHPFDRSWQNFLLARIDPTPARVEAALQSFRERYRRDPADIPGYIQTLGTFGRVDEAFQIAKNPVTLDSMEASTDVLFRPHMRSLISDPRFIELAYRLGLLAYWRKSGDWPDFCRDPQLSYDCRKEAAKYRS